MNKASLLSVERMMSDPINDQDLDENEIDEMFTLDERKISNLGSHTKAKDRNRTSRNCIEFQIKYCINIMSNVSGVSEAIWSLLFNIVLSNWDAKKYVEIMNHTLNNKKVMNMISGNQRIISETVTHFSNLNIIRNSFSLLNLDLVSGKSGVRLPCGISKIGLSSRELGLLTPGYCIRGVSPRLYYAIALLNLKIRMRSKSYTLQETINQLMSRCRYLSSKATDRMKLNIMEDIRRIATNEEITNIEVEDNIDDDCASLKSVYLPDEINKKNCEKNPEKCSSAQKKGFLSSLLPMIGGAANKEKDIKSQNTQNWVAKQEDVQYSSKGCVEDNSKDLGKGRFSQRLRKTSKSSKSDSDKEAPEEEENSPQVPYYLRKAQQKEENLTIDWTDYQS